jgi:hypothetical protein
MLTLFMTATKIKTKKTETLIPIHRPNKKISVSSDYKGFASNLKYYLAFFDAYLNLFF